MHAAKPRSGTSGTSEMEQKTTTKTPRVARPLKSISGDTDSPSSANSCIRSSTERSSKVSEKRSPRSPVTEVLCQKKRPSRAVELESQIAQLQDDLKRAKDQLSSSESAKKKVQQEAEEAKKQLADVASKLDHSQHQLIELSASEDARLIELRKISQERDRSWESELNAIQNQHSMDSDALAAANQELQRLKQELTVAIERAKYAEEAYVQLDVLKMDMSQTLDLVDDLNAQLEQCQDSEAEAQAQARETLHYLEAAKHTIEMFRSDRYKSTESLNTLAFQLEEAQGKIKLLEQHIVDLQSDLIQVGNKPLLDVDCQLKADLDAAKEEIEHLKCLLESSEARLQETEIESELKIHSAHEAVEFFKSESQELFNNESGTLSKLKEAEQEMEKMRVEVSELKANLMDKETELQSIVEENDGLKSEIRKRIPQENEAMIANAIAVAESAKVGEQEALLRLGCATAEVEKNGLRVARLTEQLDAAHASNQAMEAELKRLRVQTEQWKKAADAAAAVLATAHNGKAVERTGSMDSSVYSNVRVGSPYYDDMDDNSPKKKTAMLKRFGELWRKKSPHK